ASASPARCGAKPSAHHLPMRPRPWPGSVPSIRCGPGPGAGPMVPAPRPPRGGPPDGPYWKSAAGHRPGAPTRPTRPQERARDDLSAADPAGRPRRGRDRAAGGGARPRGDPSRCPSGGPGRRRRAALPHRRTRPRQLADGRLRAGRRRPRRRRERDPAAGPDDRGRRCARRPGAGTARPIMTGAPIPAGAALVIPGEESARGRFGPSAAEDAAVTLTPTDVRAGRFVRTRGSDTRRGDTVLREQRLLTPPRIAHLAACGIRDVEVVAPVRTIVMSTGSEVRSAGEGAPDPGALFDANGPGLAAALADAGAEVVHTGSVPDDPSELLARLREQI